MSEFKQISIDPAHFQYSANKDTRKKRSKSGDGSGEDGSNPIKIRGPPKHRDDHNKTTKRNALLKFIRRHQSDNYQKLLEQGGGNNGSGEPSNAPPRSTHKSEIDDTLDYLMNVADEVRQKEIVRGGTGLGNGIGHGMTHQHTLKRNIPTHEYVSTEFPTSGLPSGVVQTRIQPSNIHLNPRPLPLPPQYGILKGGNMPTYREWRQKPGQCSGSGVSNIGGGSPVGSLIPSSLISSTPLSPIQSSYQMDANSSSNNKSWLPNHEDYVLGKGGSVSRTSGSEADRNSKVRLKIMRQRRTSRRTFKVGKSKNHPKVGVLISNRTIRKTVSTKALHLKQIPITEVKRYLVKHGLIRVGTASPDYMLRKLYESVQMIPGEIHNHNVDNLLYNFINTRDDK